jgi:hypothetical protein
LEQLEVVGYCFKVFDAIGRVAKFYFRKLKLAKTAKNWSQQQGCQIFLGATHHKIYQMALKYQITIKIPNFPYQGLQKYTKIWIFGLQIYHPCTTAKKIGHNCQKEDVVPVPMKTMHLEIISLLNDFKGFDFVTSAIN